MQTEAQVPDENGIITETGGESGGGSGPTTYTPPPYTPTLGANGEPQPPPQPYYESCTTYSGYAKTSCDNRNKAKIDQYTKDVNTYNAAKAKWVSDEQDRRKKQTQ